MMSSDAARKKGLDSDSGDSTSVSSRPEDDRKQPHMRWSDTSSTTNEPALASAIVTVSVAAARQPTSQSGLPTFAAAAAAAAPRVPMKEKKPRRAGFREQFLQKLRVMLDRESRNDSTTVQWSTDGNSFIITDQNQFEEHIIPTYFDNPIVFASFLSKIYRWGFNRVASRRAGRFEFCSPTFKRLDADSAPSSFTATAAAAAAAASASAANTSSNDEGGAPIQVQHQPAQIISSLLQQVMAQTNQLPAHNPKPSQADANTITDLISNLISNLQAQLSNQQSLLNQNTNRLNDNVGNSILQGFLSGNQQSLLSPQSKPSHLPHQSTTNPLNINHTLQPFQQPHHPNPTLNLLNAVRSILVGGQAPSSVQLLGHSSPSSQINAVQTLMRLYGMSSPQPSLPNINNSPAMSQLLVFVMQRVVEDELQRRAQLDAIQNAVMTTIGRNTGQGGILNNTIVHTQQGIIPLSMPTTYGSTNTAAPQPQQEGAPSSSPLPAGNLNIQADSITAILQATRRGDAAGQLGNDDDSNGDDHEGRPLSPRKRKSPDDDQYDTDDDSWTERLRSRNKSPGK